MLQSALNARAKKARKIGVIEEYLNESKAFSGVLRVDEDEYDVIRKIHGDVAGEFNSRNKAMNFDECLHSVSICGIDWFPVNLLTKSVPKNGLDFVELQPYFKNPDGSLSLIGFSQLRFGLMTFNPLILDGEEFTINNVNPNRYALAMLAHVLSQYKFNNYNVGLLSKLLVSPSGINDTYLSELLNYRADTRFVDPKSVEKTPRFREQFQDLFHEFNFVQYYTDNDAALLSLTFSLLKHKHSPGPSFGQSLNYLVAFDKSKGIPIGRKGRKLTYVAINRRLKDKLIALFQAESEEVLAPLKAYETDCIGRGFRGQDAPSEFLQEHRNIAKYGLIGTLVKTLGPRKNIGRYVLYSERNVASKSFARKVEHYHTASELLETFNRNVVARDHGSGQQGVAISDSPGYAQAFLRSIFGITVEEDVDSVPEYSPEQHRFQVAYLEQKLVDSIKVLGRRWGPPMNHCGIVPEQRVFYTDSDWVSSGTYDDAEVKQRLRLECSLSYRYRLAANILENGLVFLKHDIIHGDIKPANMYFVADQPVLSLQRRLRNHDMSEFTQFTEEEKALWFAGEQPLDGDFGTVWVGNTQGDVIPHDRGQSFTQIFTSYRYITYGSEDFVQINGEQHTFNYLVTASLILCGYANDVLPKSDLREFNHRFVLAQRDSELASQAYMRSTHASEEKRERLRLAAYEKRVLFDAALVDMLMLYTRDHGLISPLFQQATDNINGYPVWSRKHVLKKLRSALNPDFLAGKSRPELIVLLRNLSDLFRQEALYLENAGEVLAVKSRSNFLRYMQDHQLRFNPDSYLINRWEPVEPEYDDLLALERGEFTGRGPQDDEYDTMVYTVQKNPETIGTYQIYSDVDA